MDGGRMSATNDPSKSAEQEVSETEWSTIAFAPAPAGWCAHFAEGADRWSTPIAGWLTQENERARRFVAALANDVGELVPVDPPGGTSHLVAIRGPGGFDRGALSASQSDDGLDLPRQLRDALGTARRAVTESAANYATVDPVATSTQSDAELGRQIERTADLLRHRPATLGVAAVPNVLADIERLTASAADERERLAAAVRVDNKGNRWRRSDPVIPPRSSAILEGITARLKEAQKQLGEAEHKVAARREWDDEHMPELARGVAAGDELAWRQQARKVVLSWPSTRGGPGLGLGRSL